MAKPADFTPGAVKALVLQGGGALGAYEWGAVRWLHGDGYRPDVISGVSIGALTAVLLARPKGGDPLAALQGFWDRVAIPSGFLGPALRGYATYLGSPAFFMPRQDYLSLPGWTSFYDLLPLQRTLSDLVDLEALADPEAKPRLLVTATNIEQGEIEIFDSAKGLTLDPILASASLPPAFPPKRIGQSYYWDGGLFDNTPLGAVLECLDPSPERADDREIVVVNLFSNAMKMPQTLSEVGQRVFDLIFTNKTHSDIKLMRRFNAVAALVDLIRQDGRWKDLETETAFTAVAEEKYITLPAILEITRSSEVPYGPDLTIDFSPEAIAARRDEGHADAAEAWRRFRRPPSGN